jgi:hypothetical protein
MMNEESGMMNGRQEEVSALELLKEGLTRFPFSMTASPVLIHHSSFLIPDSPQ